MIYALVTTVVLFFVCVTGGLYFVAAFVSGLLDEQAGERATMAVETQNFLALHTEQVERLLQRIQAPDVAVMQYAAEPEPPAYPLVEPLPFDDDAAYRASREDLAASL